MNRPRLNSIFKCKCSKKSLPTNWLLNCVYKHRRQLKRIINIPSRCLHLHEYANFELLSENGVPIPVGKVADTAKQAREIVEEMGKDDMMIKAQVLTGGRGKGTFRNGFKGGVHRVFSGEEAEEVASHMINQYLVTKQTGEDGVLCPKVFVTERLNTKREYYFSIIMDRRHAGPILIGSSQGGVDIEETAASNPRAIVTQAIDIQSGLKQDTALDLAQRMGFKKEYLNSAADVMMKLYEVFLKYDVTMLEINPLSELAGGIVVCMDCKMNYDDNAEYRQKKVFSLRDQSQENDQERAASDMGLNYIKLDGDIGCMVNGAGLAMATMDIIQLHGGSPANFLDIGGGASIEQVTEAFQLISSDQHVNAILVNIFGGIVRCDSVAKGIIMAAEDLRLEIPIVVRLQGTNLKEAKDLMEASSIRIHPYDNLDEAAQKVVKMAAIKAVAKEAKIPIEFTIGI